MYILKRLALMVPTLIGVVTLTFVVTQFVPGGPVEQIMTQLRHGARPCGTSASRSRSALIPAPGAG